MTMQSNGMRESPLDPPATTPAALSATRPFYWSVRRELWENRSIYVAPLAVAALVLFGFLISTRELPRVRRALSSLSPSDQAAAAALPYDIAAVAIILTAVIVGVFYCLGALHNERRDRTILFWKSLPVSDLTTVLSKATIPLVVVPLVAFAVIIATQLIMLVLSGAILMASGLTAVLPTSQLPSLEGSLVLLYGVATLTLWYAPIYGWLMVVSGWARRAPFLWAVLPPLALDLVERIAFGTHYVGSLLSYRIGGGFDEAFDMPARVAGKGHVGIPIVGLAQLDPGKYLSTPGLWVGLAFAAALFAGAVWLRRYREPI